MKRALLSIAVAAGLWAACSSANPNRPCEEPTVAQRCPASYACVPESHPIFGEREVCVAIGAKTIGEPCLDATECEGYEQGTAICADQARTCPSNGTPTDPKGCDFRCRRVCQVHTDCPDTDICYPGGGVVTGVCQPGECGESHRDCPGDLECAWFKGGDTGGICFPPCDILRQAECDQTPPPNDAKCCAPQEACVHFASNPSAATCLTKGNGRIGDLCSTTESNNRPACGEGLFCSDQLPCPTGNCEFRCEQYCNRGTGGPVCEVPGSTCAAIPGGSDLQYGYCQ